MLCCHLNTYICAIYRNSDPIHRIWTLCRAVGFVVQYDPGLDGIVLNRKWWWPAPIGRFFSGLHLFGHPPRPFLIQLSVARVRACYGIGDPCVVSGCIYIVMLMICLHIALLTDKPSCRTRHARLCVCITGNSDDIVGVRPAATYGPCRIALARRRSRRE